MSPKERKKKDREERENVPQTHTKEGGGADAGTDICKVGRVTRLEALTSSERHPKVLESGPQPAISVPCPVLSCHPTRPRRIFKSAQSASFSLSLFAFTELTSSPLAVLPQMAWHMYLRGAHSTVSKQLGGSTSLFPYLVHKLKSGALIAFARGQLARPGS